MNYQRSVNQPLIKNDNWELIRVDFSKATNQQLYEIAKGEKNRMKDRYAAASELQRRKKEQQDISLINNEKGWF